ncbi:hypothetical protein EU527_19835 [Candidatus Thorarchaeota archaeon]|nr:MAG: hypothetical protein EU527_19835 [Candidatus Thorarchaeota archaeon]
MDINSIYIIRRDTGVCMYHKDFTGSAFDPQLLSSFLVAMTSFFDEATRSIKSQARAFEGTDYTILVEFGEWTLGAISTKIDSQYVRDKLKRTIIRFEEQFSVLKWVDLDLAVQTRFEQTIMNEFVREQITEDSLITVKPAWEHYTKRPDVISFLRLIPDICSVKDAASFLEVPVEIALNLTAEALWEGAIVVANPVRPDDIYQATSLTHSEEMLQDLTPDAIRALNELDGETPLSIAAERLKTSDLKRFLEEVAWLQKRKMIELVSPSQAVVVRYSSALQLLLNRLANILGKNVTRSIFYSAREKLIDNYSWLAFVTLEEGVDVEMRSTLLSATLKGTISPDILDDGLRVFMQFITRRVMDLIGSGPINKILYNTKDELERRFPSTVFHIEWESFLV